MTWNLKKTIGGSDAAAPPVEVPPPPKKRSRSRNARSTDTSAQVRRSAGIVLRPTGAGAARGQGVPPELLYAKDHKCAFCRGTGQLSDDSVCPVCRGDGRVSAPSPVVRCVFCKGHGQVPPRSTLSCGVCKGRGIVPVRPPIQLCPDCRGRGKQRGQSLYCNRCRGTGVITSAHRSNDTSGISNDIENEPKLGRKAS